MDLKNNIKIFGAFKKFIDSLYAIITAVRIAAVIIRVMQAICLISESGQSISDFKFK